MKQKYVLFGDANSPHVYKWYKELVKKYDVYVITFSKISKFTYKNYYCYGANATEGGGNFRYLCKIVPIYILLKKIGPNIVNAHYVTSYGFISSLIRKLLPFKLVISAWGTDILVTPKRSLWYALITRFSLSQADIITSDSFHMSSEIGLMTKKRVTTFPMGIDEAIIYRNNVKRTAYTFLSLRNLIPNSNVDEIIKAFSMLPKGKVRLIIGNDGSERENLEKLAVELGVSENIEFVGYLAEDEIFTLMRSCQTYITIPTSDALSVSLMEALSSEMLIIASDLPANRELLNSNNAFFSGINAEELKKAMSKSLCLSESQIKDVYSYNRYLLENKCLWKNNIKALYEELECRDDSI